MKLVKNDTVLFLGDSITDCDRDRQDPHDLGHGFARLVADQLAEKFPTAGFTFYNRGIGGNKAADVLARLQEDCLQLAPDVLVFMIGINDTWGTMPVVPILVQKLRQRPLRQPTVKFWNK